MELDYKERFKEYTRLIQLVEESGVFGYIEDKLGKTIMYKRRMEFIDGIAKLIDKTVDERITRFVQVNGLNATRDLI